MRGTPTDHVPRLSVRAPSVAWDRQACQPLNAVRGICACSASQNSGDGTSASATVRVLVVEDDEPVRSHIVRIVTALGFRVRTAGSGMDALQALSADLRCDLLVTDVVMPRMSGGQLAQAARLLSPGLPVVFVTAHNVDPIVEQLCRDGRAVMLPKPFRRQMLVAALMQALRCG
ncbi:response regulator [Falsiroseomonas tokyonensis]|uniref:Response regulator n=1 Tax=Falsiroseomonas tokyonensis TaxID=430521 RepID=A0ABV7BTJ1_9PROT|nr:response regulator [Falsiroseomonas tokyonensis]MBU8537338.1 response regulator [Falsiroseomonas tokyonensis]